MEKSTIAWITATALILIAVGSYTLELESKSLDLKLADGKVLFSYKEGIAKFYSGRYLASKDWIKPFYWNGAYYAQMYKKRGDKYSNLSYYKDGDITYIKQIILYSRGNLTRYFEISEYDVKESFEFIPNDLTLRTYFKWNYDGLDLGRKEVYLDGKKKETQAVMDFDIINDWSKEIDNIKRAERFLNGRMTIRTRVFEGVATFDPKIIIDDGIKNNPGDTIKWGFGVNDEYLDPIWYGKYNRTWIIEKSGAETELEVKYDILDDTSTEFCIKVKDKGDYANKALGDTTDIPITIMNEGFTIEKEKINLKDGELEIEECFIVEYERFVDGMEFKIGWQSVIVVSSTDEGKSTNDLTSWHKQVIYDSVNNRWHSFYVDDSSDISSFSSVDRINWGDEVLLDTGSYNYDDFSCAFNLNETDDPSIHCVYTPTFDVLKYRKGILNNTAPYIFWGAEQTPFDSEPLGGTDLDETRTPKIILDSDNCVLIDFILKNDSAVTDDKNGITLIKEDFPCNDGIFSISELKSGFPIFDIQIAPGFNSFPTIGLESFGDLDAQIFWIDTDSTISADLESAFFNGTTDTIGSVRVLDGDVEFSTIVQSYSSVVFGDKSVSFAMDDGTVTVDSYLISTRNGALSTQRFTNLRMSNAASGLVTSVVNPNSEGSNDIWVFVSNRSASNSFIYYSNSSDGGLNWEPATLWQDIFVRNGIKYLTADIDTNNCTIMVKWLQGNASPWNTTVATLDIQPCDAQPLLVESVTNVSTTNVSITWETTFNKKVNMTGTFGLFPSYSDLGTFSNSTRSITLKNLTEGLINNTRYGWNITSFCDVFGNCNDTGFNFTFVTSQYVIPTNPTWSQNKTNNIEAGKSTLFSVLWENNIGLSSYIFSWFDGENWTQINNSGDQESGEQSEVAGGGGSDLHIWDSFETNFTEPWKDDGIVEAWTRKTDGTTSSNTGPQPQGSAQGADGAYFIYVETSSAECNTNGETAITLTTDSIDFDAGINDQITWYNSMYGADIGTLLLQENTTGSWNTLWTMSGDQGSSPVWFQNITDLSALEGIGHLRFHYTCAGGFTGDAAIDAINITSEAASSNEVNKTAIEYLNVLNEDIYFNIDNITVTVQVSYYNTSGSIANNNLNATLWLEVYNGTSWIDEGDFGVGTIQAVQNYSILVTTPSVLNGWGILSNRDIRISARLMDFNDSNTFDTINWTGVWSIVGSNQEFLNDSSVDFTGIINTSNVTKTITSTVGATIKWQVFANNTNNLFNQTDIFQFVTTGGVVDSDPPIITLLSPDNETTNTTSRVIDFLYNVTDESSISSCELIINGSNNKTVTSPAKNTTNNITQFLNNGNYTWQVNCTDSSTNEGNSSIRNINTNVDIIPPTFIQAPLNFSTFNESSGVNWSSNELTNFTLTYGICPSFSGSTINNNTFRLNQSQNLTSLTNNTNYCVNVSIWDSSSNTNSSFFNFTTQQYTPPDETAPTFIQEPNNFSTFNASSGVNWSNNELANFTLTYGVCPTFTETTINNNTFRFNQSQNLTSLINNTNYCVNVTVWDNSSNRNESNFNFTTQQYTPPDEKAPTFVQLPLNFSTFNASSGVNWSSNELTNFSLTYGTCPTFTGTTINNNTFRFNQSQNLTGLNNNTNYCVNVTIWDSSSNRNDSSFNFTTQPYNLSIVILNLASSSVTNQSAIVSWDCSKACNYSIKVYNNSVRNTTNLINSTDNNSFATSHVFPLTQLINFTTYFVNLTVFDSISNSTENNSLNFTTSQYIVTQGAITFLALPTNHTTKATTTFVNWSTDPAGNYTLTYGTCPSFLGITSVRTDFETSRNVQLINLLRNTTYCVNVSVADSNTNKNSSSFNFTTLDVDYLRLDGLEENRTYEYETTVNITSSLNYFTIYDDTNRYINRRLTSCYQEFANVSTPCGGLDSGAYSISASSGVGNPAWYDGNFSTQSNSGVAWTFRINYTVPNGTVSADWRVKDGFQLNSTTDERILRVNDTCFNVSGKIILEIARNGGGEPINYSCRNASNDLIQVDSKWLGFLFYEEAIWWNYESQPNLLDRFNYLIDILRVNTTSANVVNGSSYNVSIDADSDLYNASFNITGNGNVGNLSINYTQFIYFPGLLIGHNLYQNEFIFGSNRFTTRNISFLSAETKTIFINYSAEGNPDTRQGFWNFTITAFDSDANNEMTFLAQFNQTNTTNDILNGTWHPIGDMGGFNNTFFTFSNNASNSFWKGFISWRKDQSTCDEAGNLGGDDTCISTSGGVAQLNKRMYNEHTDLSLVNYFTTQIIMRCHCNCESRLEFYDLTNTVLIENVQQLGCPFDNTFVRDSCNITGTRTPGTEIWKIVTSGSGCTDKGVSVAGLTTPYYISLNNPTGSDSSTAYTYVNVFKNFNIGGIYLNKSYNRTSGIEGAAAATHSGNFTTHLINTTTDDIVRATLSYNQIITENHNITAYLSNDDGATFEEIVNNSAHTFFSVGNQIRARFEMFSNVNWSNPIVTEYTVSIESAPMSSLIVDIGADDNFDFDFDFELNSSTTPIYLDNDSSINNYIENSCENQSFCLIPIEFASGSAGTLQLNELNLTENINPIRINTTAVQDLSEIKHYVIFHQGTSVTFDDVRYDYRGNKNITIEAHTADHSSAINRTIEVVYSVFNLSFPPNVNFWEVFFDFRNQTLKAPFGQNSSDGIWKVDNLADHDKGIDLYTRWNQSVNSCLLEDRFVGYNNNNDSSFNISLSTTGQRIIQNITTETNDIFAYSTINCSASVNVVITPFFCFYSMCSECVFTSDAHESECLIQ